MTLAEIGRSGDPSDGLRPVRTLVARTHEQGAVRELIDSVRAGRSGALVLRGEPAIGRSALLGWARDEASDLRLLSVVGLETEAKFPYAGIHRMLLPLLDGIAALPAHHAQALTLAFGQADGAAPDRLAVGLAVLGLLTKTAERGPVLCLAHDVHRLDPASSEVLGIVARRLYAGGIGVIATVRDHDAAAALDGVDHVDVGPVAHLYETWRVRGGPAEKYTRDAGVGAALADWDPERHREMLRHLERRQRALGDLDCLRITLLGLCRSELWAGNFASANAHRQEAASLSLEIDGPGASADLWAASGAELTAWQGLERETRSSFAVLTGEYSRAVGARAAQSIGRLALTTLELSLGRSREALRAARVLFDEDVPPDATLVLPDLVEAGVRSGDTGTAQAAFARLVERSGCSGTDWALGVNARCRALLSDGGEAETQFQLALEHLGRTVVRTDLARTHILYGEWLRRGKRRIDARRQLSEAHSLFERMGARLFADRARREMEATGAQVRKRSPDRAVDLTPQEDRIARRAAAGDTNAEIAERLYISPRTVDYHLRKVYRKLGVASRRDLRSLFPPA